MLMACRVVSCAACYCMSYAVVVVVVVIRLMCAQPTMRLGSAEGRSCPPSPPFPRPLARLPDRMAGFIHATHLSALFIPAMPSLTSRTTRLMHVACTHSDAFSAPSGVEVSSRSGLRDCAHSSEKCLGCAERNANFRFTPHLRSIPRQRGLSVRPDQ